MAKKVVVGMSGGVDSSVAAAILKEQGYVVIGLHMKNSSSPSQDEDELNAQSVCDKLSIKMTTINYSSEMEDVKKYFIDEYKNGRTPNPCVVCNKTIKFKPFLDYANSIGADYVATGHYCRISHENGVHRLLKAKDTNKDQTYFLNQLSQEQLSHVLFPLGDMLKPEVREYAKKIGLVTAQKKESMDICFVGSGKFKEYLKSCIKPRKGDIKSLDGKVVGTHDGIMYYTLGQRRGLNIGGTKDGNGKRWFVCGKDVKNNILYVNQGEDDKLLSTSLISLSVNWIPNKPITPKFSCYAKFRYRQVDEKVTVTIRDNDVLVEFDTPQRAVTPGQYVVFYTKDECLGGGIIDSVSAFNTFDK